MRGQGNCTLSVAGYGTRSCYAVRVQHGINVVASQGQSRNQQAFYPVKRTSGSFGLVLLFPTHADYQSMALWLANYAMKMADGTDRLGPMRVQIPGSEFDKIAIVKDGIDFGDKMEAVTYQLNLGFEGARDSLDHASGLISTFSFPEGVDTIGRYFFPAGTPLDDASPNQTPWYLYQPGTVPNAGQPGVQGTIGYTGNIQPPVAGPPNPQGVVPVIEGN